MSNHILFTKTVKEDTSSLNTNMDKQTESYRMVLSNL